MVGWVAKEKRVPRWAAAGGLRPLPSSARQRIVSCSLSHSDDITENNSSSQTNVNFLAIKKRRLLGKGFNSTGSGPSFHIWISGIGSVFDDANDVSHFELMSHFSGMHILFCFELFIAYSSSHPPLGAQRSLLNFRQGKRLWWSQTTL